MDDAQREAIVEYCRIAEASGALLSIKDLVELLGSDTSEEELEEGIAADESLASKVFVESGLAVSMGPGSDRGLARKAIEEAKRRRSRAIANIEAARAFARLFSKDATFVAVAGANSYLSAVEGDDIDYYCITKTDGMWAFMLKALILSRIRSLTRRSVPPFCFSYVMDERQVRDVSSRPKTAVHARDALTVAIVSGDATYQAILENEPWMRSYFPTIYDRRLRETRSRNDQHRSAGKGSLVVNWCLFLTLGSYLGLKAWLLNRRLAGRGRSDAVFKTWIEPGRLEYASRRYLELGKMYQALEKR
ncbi:MAG TPA: hypothetical protein VND41_02480 [Nitrososphaerales archaeon]|nr:hypothetical protein [Nitrososphaerales archaeon]